MSDPLESMSPGIVALLWAGRVLGAFVVVCSLLPLLPTGSWLVRACDFPRAQLAMLSVVPLVIIAGVAVRHGARLEAGLSIVLLLAAMCWQGWHVIRYTPVWTPTVPTGDVADLRLLVCNLDYENDRHDAVRQAITDTDADVLLLIEINDTWREACSDVAETYPFRIETIRDDGLGLALWSRQPLKDERIEHRVLDDRPSIDATIMVNDRPLRFIGVHPTPPGLSKRGEDGRHDSRIRDAELVLVARDVAQDPDASWLVAGDFNDVAWSHTTQLFERLSGLNDPRVGRGMFSTYHAEYALLRYPLDHVFVSAGIHVTRLDRIRLPGSDHFAMLAELGMTGAAEGTEPNADNEDRREAETMVDEGLEDAAELEGR